MILNLIFVYLIGFVLGYWVAYIHYKKGKLVLKY
jgi:hypothetical protein